MINVLKINCGLLPATPISQAATDRDRYRGSAAYRWRCGAQRGHDAGTESAYRLRLQR